MTPLSPQSATQRVGQYAHGSIAGRGTSHAGGTRRRDEDPATFWNRMDSRKAASRVTPPQQTRQDRVIASRLDGTFATKRDTFNQSASAKGLTMNEAGDIVPLAPVSQSPSPPVSKSPVSPSPRPQVSPPSIPGIPTAPAPGAPPAGTSPLGTPWLPDGTVLPNPTAGPVTGAPAPGAPPAPTPVTASVTPPVTRHASVTPTSRHVTPKPPPLPSPNEQSFLNSAPKPYAAPQLTPDQQSALTAPLAMPKLEADAARAKHQRRGLLTNVSETVGNALGTVVDKGASALKTGMRAAGKIAAAAPPKASQIFTATKNTLLGSDELSEAEKRLEQAKKSLVRPPAMLSR